MVSLSIQNPIYIVSKGRWERPLTARIFLKEKIPFKIVVEPQEYDLYCQAIGREFVLKLPFSNLGLGSYPARNWIWDHSIETGASKHFIFDDNIQSFSRLNNGKRTRCTALEACSVLETFVNKFTNVAISGFNYRYFVTREKKVPFHINTKVYSGILIRNDIPFRWRLKYNEDVDLCLQALHTRKWCTILLNAFLIDKTSTAVKMKGGNQDELYKNNDPSKKALKARSLEMVWPQYCETVWRWNRPHHFVDWKKHFTHPLEKVVKPSSPQREGIPKVFTNDARRGHFKGAKDDI